MNKCSTPWTTSIIRSAFALAKLRRWTVQSVRLTGYKRSSTGTISASRTGSMLWRLAVRRLGSVK